MGQAKRLMMEMESYEWEDAAVSFICPDPECGKLSDGEAELPIVYEAQVNDVCMPITLECSCCREYFDAEIQGWAGELTIKLSDYPETEVTFDNIIRTNLAHEEDYWDMDPFDYDLPERPIDIFLSSYADITGFLEIAKSNQGNSAFNRMVFIQCFSTFEAYLCDRFLNLVFSSETNIRKFVAAHSELKDSSIPVRDLFAVKEKTAEELLNAEITRVIKETLFHNFGKAIALFHIFRISLIDDENDKTLLFKAAQLRHHCVHRNGRDHDGNELYDFHHSYLEKVATVMKKTATSLEEELE